MQLTGLAPHVLACCWTAGTALAVAHQHDPAPPPVSRDIATITSVVEEVSKALGQLDGSVKAFDSSALAPAQLAADAGGFVGLLKEGAARVRATAPIELTDALTLQSTVGELQRGADGLIGNLKAAKARIEDAGLCATVRQSLADAGAGSKALIDAIVSKVPVEAQGIASQIAGGVVMTLTAGQTSFAEGSCIDKAPAPAAAGPVPPPAPAAAPPPAPASAAPSAPPAAAPGKEPPKAPAGPPGNATSPDMPMLTPPPGLPPMPMPSSPGMATTTVTMMMPCIDPGSMGNGTSPKTPPNMLPPPPKPSGPASNTTAPNAPPLPPPPKPSGPASNETNPNTPPLPAPPKPSGPASNEPNPNAPPAPKPSGPAGNGTGTGPNAPPPLPPPPKPSGGAGNGSAPPPPTSGNGTGTNPKPPPVTVGGSAQLGAPLGLVGGMVFAFLVLV